jgi:hypothetical protein
MIARFNQKLYSFLSLAKDLLTISDGDIIFEGIHIISLKKLGKFWKTLLNLNTELKIQEFYILNTFCQRGYFLKVAFPKKT